MLKNLRIVVLNYCMDSSHPSLGHQISVVNKLAENFAFVEVLTTTYSGEQTPSNVNIKVVPWESKRPIYNGFNLFRTFLKICLNSKPDFVFSHMAPLNSLVIAPITRALKIPHSLWYAHAHKPTLLRLAVASVNTVISSTKGSFPFETSKLILIGQGVDATLFTKQDDRAKSTYDFIYAGRMNSSKNVKQIVTTLEELKSSFPEITLTLVGNGSASFLTESNSDWLIAKESVARENLPFEMSQHGVFIHAFIGSLDKVLVEAAMLKMPIISTNPEFLREFVTFAPSNSQDDLESQIRNFYSQDAKQITQLVQFNYDNSITNHELSGWINRLTKAITLLR